MDSSRPKLGPIIGATILCANIEEAIGPYLVDLGYKQIGDGVVSRALARAWNAPAHIGARTATLGPESNNPPWIRFVESPKVAGYRAMTTFGWHSLEINVQDVDRIPKRLEHSSFRIVGDPHALGMSSTIRAMQVIGVAEEALYLTQIPDDGSLPHLPIAETFIDRIFIVPLGSPNMDETRAWYLKHFPNIQKGMEARDIKISLINDALNIDPDTKCSICTIRLPEKTSIEIDDYPAAATLRPRNPESLPPGICTVSFAVDSLEKVSLDFIGPIGVIPEFPYNQRKMGVIVGNASEMIELVEE